MILRFFTNNFKAVKCMIHREKIITYLLTLIVVFAFHGFNNAYGEQDLSSGKAGIKLPPSRFVENGVSIEFNARPFNNGVKQKGGKGNTGIRAGDEVKLEFVVTDAHTGVPLKGMAPDSITKRSLVATTQKGVEEAMIYIRTRAVKRGRMNAGHPPLMESSYIMCLNVEDNTIAVINPFMKPKTVVKTIELGEQGVDLCMAEQGAYLYITCKSGKVLVMDCARLKLSGSIKVGKNPHHIELQPDEKYVWVGNDGDGTVSVIDHETGSLVKNIKVGNGHHEFAFTDDSLLAFATNRDDNSLSIIDIFKLKVVQTVKTGDRPHGVAYSTLGKYVYTANEGSGDVTVYDVINKNVVQTIKTEAGTRAIRFSDDERYGFAVNKMSNSVSVIDIGKNKVVKTVPTGIRPESVIFSSKYAYVRNVGSPDVTIIKLEGFERVGDIPVGFEPPNSVELEEGHLDIGDSFAAIIPDPVDGFVYTIMFGDKETSFKYKFVGKGPAKVEFYWRGLKEVAPGVYSRILKFDKPGFHSVGFYIGNPELAAGFGIYVNPSQ